MIAFTLRDGTLEMIEDGDWAMSPTSYALLWFLLYHGIYDRNSKWFGHVNIKVTSQERLARAVGAGERSVRRALAELEANGFVIRHARYSPDGGRLNDDIELSTPQDFCLTCRTRGHNEAQCQEGVTGQNGPTPRPN